MELLPDRMPVLTKQRYPEPFSGLRDVRLPGQAHHLHLDFGKIAQVEYAVVPSVCYGYRPSFEVHFIHKQATAPSFAVMVRKPYRNGVTNRAALLSYFRRMRDHLARFPDLVRSRVEVPDACDDVRACIEEAFVEAACA